MAQNLIHHIEVNRTNISEEEEESQEFDMGSTHKHTSGSVLTAQPISEQNEKEQKTVELFCKCKIYSTDPAVSGKDWIECSKSYDCISRKKRLEEMKLSGGSWFHKTCISNSSNKKKSLWFCENCKVIKKETDRSLLVKRLKGENLKINTIAEKKGLNIFIALCSLEYKSSQPNYLTPFKGQIIEKLDEIINECNLVSTEFLQNSEFETAKTLLKEHCKIDFSKFNGEKAVQFLERENIHVLNTIIINIYGRLSRKDIFIL